ncbi:Gamma-glutamylcyclotransferase family protein [Psidium guajava]|nr:Gamma-glutamylcyclotransferase family protein [Psidium guajava]
MGSEVKEEGEGVAVAVAVVFTYGTLKKGFHNHRVLDELMATGEAAFLGRCRTSIRYPLVCGPYRVPFLLDLPGRGRRVSGELYSVSSERALSLLDELEGTSRGHYQRRPIEVVELVEGEEDEEEEEEGQGEERKRRKTRRAEAYYADSRYAMEMWNKCGKEGYGSYTEEVARGYVKRGDRPPHFSFLDHIRFFLSSSSSSSPC